MPHIHSNRKRDRVGRAAQCLFQRSSSLDEIGQIVRRIFIYRVVFTKFLEIPQKHPEIELRISNARHNIIWKDMQSIAFAISDRQRQALNRLRDIAIDPAFRGLIRAVVDCDHVIKDTTNFFRELAKKNSQLPQLQFVLTLLDPLTQLKRRRRSAICCSAEHKDCYSAESRDGYSCPVCKVSNVRRQRTDFDCHDPSLINWILPCLGWEEGAAHG
ncbi:hypothetical protein SMJ63A_70129 [Stenotrophomonas geniculata]